MIPRLTELISTRPPQMTPPPTAIPQPHKLHQPYEDISRFLAKKDLLMSRLTRFSDKPESYYVWKQTFQTVTKELRVTDSEELDLLVRWLGPESSKHAVSIRNYSSDNSSLGLQRLWQRLDERYGAPERIEMALRNKLYEFPKLTNKDSLRLYELCDILAEIESLKRNPVFSQMLSYLDSSFGIKPIVCKLPYGMQEKWTNRAVNYKKVNGVVFPPFSEFVEFVRETSQIKNDPGFDYENETPLRSRNLPVRNFFENRNKVDVNKVEVDNLDR
jgi:hypothetical protein